uniref:trypsin n=1 Tax=Anabas testudineus TaxID=64144 RepID=A0A3Q1KG32_ANATE
MSVRCELLILILVLILGGQVHTGTISGGHEAVPHSRPYMALVLGHKQNGEPKYCGGFLLNEDFVMTTATCQEKSHTVILGLHDIHNSPGNQTISVQQAFPHKDYNATSYENDIILLKLSTKAQINKNVRPIALADRDDGNLPKRCIVSGWGKSNINTHYMSPKLMEVNVTLIDYKLCTMDNFYCSEGETGPAEGDAGGPLVCEDGKAFGVMSSSHKSHSGHPKMHRYAKIFKHQRWITSIMTDVVESSTNLGVSGSIPSSSGLLAEVSLDKTPKPHSSADLYCLAVVKPQSPKGDQ